MLTVLQSIIGVWWIFCQNFIEPVLTRGRRTQRWLNTNLLVRNFWFANCVGWLADIAVNLTDPMFRGYYHGRKIASHPDDLVQVLQRSIQVGVEKIIATGTSLVCFQETLELLNGKLLSSLPENFLYCTVGCHPTEVSSEFESKQTKISHLCEAIQNHQQYIVAIGEIGLDYERLQFSPRESQLKYFRAQLDGLARIFPHLPLFLHSRNCWFSGKNEFVEVMQEFYASGGTNRGVVHSFDGNLQELNALLEMGLFISVNGCSLRTAESIATIKQIPLDRLLVETDSPWCELKQSSAAFPLIQSKLSHIFPESFVQVNKETKHVEGCIIRGRNEPCKIILILKALASILEIDSAQLADICYKNAKTLFFPV